MYIAPENHGESFDGGNSLSKTELLDLLKDLGGSADGLKTSKSIVMKIRSLTFTADGTSARVHNALFYPALCRSWKTLGVDDKTYWMESPRVVVEELVSGERGFMYFENGCATFLGRFKKTMNQVRWEHFEFSGVDIDCPYVYDVILKGGKASGVVALIDTIGTRDNPSLYLKTPYIERDALKISGSFGGIRFVKPAAKVGGQSVDEFIEYVSKIGGEGIVFKHDGGLYNSEATRGLATGKDTWVKRKLENVVQAEAPKQNGRQGDFEAFVRAGVFDDFGNLIGLEFSVRVKGGFDWETVGVVTNIQPYLMKRWTISKGVLNPRMIGLGAIVYYNEYKNLILKQWKEQR